MNSIAFSPDLITVKDRTANALVLFLILLIFLLGMSERLLQDPDTYWHIAVGEHIWSTATFPRIDEFSHTFAGTRWIAKEWLSQLIFYGAYWLEGWRGVTFLTAVVVAASCALLFAVVMRRVMTMVALAMVLLVINLSAGGFLARPQIFFLPLLILWVEGLVHAVERGTAPPWWLVPLMALWANLHASFPVALMLAALLGGEALVAAPIAERARTASRWAIFIVAALAATGATPYGYEPLLIPFRVFWENEAVRYITEWQPLQHDVRGALSILALVGTLTILVSPPGNLLRTLPNILCAYLMIQHLRFGSLFAIVAAITVAGPVAHRFPALKPQVPQSSAKARSVLHALIAVLICVSVILTVFVRPSPSAAITPSAALDAARQSGRSGAAGPVYNDFDFGGYLLYRGVKTFIDGRTDQLFGGGFMNELFMNELINATPVSDDGFMSFIEQYKVSWALVKPDSGAAAILERAAKWDRLYLDGTAVVYVKSE